MLYFIYLFIFLLSDKMLQQCSITRMSQRVLMLCVFSGIAADMRDMELCDKGPCAAGELFDSVVSKCVPCPDGAYMDQDHHRCKTCRECTKANPSNHEVVIDACTPVKDTNLGCDAYHYKMTGDSRTEPYCEHCAKCSENQKVQQECGPDTNTICVAADSVDNPKNNGTVYDSNDFSDSVAQNTSPVILISANIPLNNQKYGYVEEVSSNAIVIVAICLAVLLLATISAACVKYKYRKTCSYLYRRRQSSSSYNELVKYQENTGYTGISEYQTETEIK